MLRTGAYPKVVHRQWTPAMAIVVTDRRAPPSHPREARDPPATPCGAASPRRRALLVVAVVVAAAAIVGAPYAGARTQVESAFAAEADVPSAVGPLRTAQVAVRRDERLGDVQADAQSPWLGQQVVLSRQDPGDTTPHSRLVDRLRVIARAKDHENVLLVRPDGTPLASATPRRLTASLPYSIGFAEVDLPAARAELGAVGRLEGRGHRGIDVLADLRSVPGSAWYLVDKVETSEVATTAVLQAGVVLALATLATILGVSLAVLLFVNRQRRIIRGLHDADRERSAAARRFGQLFALARDALLLTDRSGRVIEANEAAVATYGYPRDTLVGMDARDLRAPDARATLDLDMAAAEDPGGARFETMHLRRDETPFPVEVSVRSLEIDGQRFRQSIVRDITERRRAEAAMLEQMDELRRWGVAASDREDRVIALKREVNELLTALGRDPRYASEEQDDPADD